MPTIAIIEDDQATSELFEGWLKAYDPQFSITRYSDRASAELAIKTLHFDLVLLDIMIGADTTAGVGLIHQIGKHQQCPVIVISGHPADLYRGIMLELEAWDYLQKPVSQSAVTEIVKHALRKYVPSDSPRSQAGTDSPANHAETLPDGLSIDPIGKRYPTWRGERLVLSLTQQKILHIIAKSQGTPVPYRQLVQAVPYAGGAGAVRTHMVRIRQAFKDIDPDFQSIRNVALLGYVWAKN